MMKKTMLFFIFFPLSLIGFSQTNLSEIRTAFFKMNLDTCAAFRLFEAVQKLNYQDSPLLIAYAGATEAASAPCIKGSFKKLEYFSRGKKNLEKAVQSSPKNAEIRFLRFATQANIPSFIEYNNLDEDKPIILKQLPGLLTDEKVKNFWLEASDFMLKSGKLNKEEEKTVKSLIEKYEKQ
jgi:hypothetical protein